MDEDKVVCLDFVQNRVDLSIIWFLLFMLVDVVTHPTRHSTVQVCFNDLLYNGLDVMSKPLDIVSSTLLLEGNLAFLFLFPSECFSLSSCSGLGSFLSSSTFLDFLLNFPELSHFCLVFLLFNDLENVVVRLLCLVIICIVLQLFRLHMEVVLKLAHTPNWNLLLENRGLILTSSCIGFLSKALLQILIIHSLIASSLIKHLFGIRLYIVHNQVRIILLALILNVLVLQHGLNLLTVG